MNKENNSIIQAISAAKSLKNTLRNLCILVVILCIGAIPILAQEEALRFQQAYEVIDQFIKQHMEENRSPAFALALTSAEGLLHVSTYGFADVKARIPLTPETLFEIGSISKSFTAIALLQMQEKNKFDPHAPVTKYLPWFRVNSKYEPITCHHLLSHTAGIPQNRDDIPPSLYMPFALRFQSTAYAPGKKFYYSNIGYQTLHFILEKVSGQRYADVIRKRIFEPLGMNASEAAITNDTRKRLAVGYQFFYDDRPPHSSHPLVEAPWLEYDVGDGCIASNPKDMAAYLRMLINQGKGPRGKPRILSYKSFHAFSDTIVKQNENWYYGYGIDVGRINGHKILAHGGGMVGYSTYIIADLDDGLGVAAFVNGPGNPALVARFALKALQAALHKSELPKLPPAKISSRVENAEDYAATYTSPDGKQITLVAEEEQLILFKNGHKTNLERRSKDAFYVNHPDYSLFLMRFGRDNDDKVVELTYGPQWYINNNYSGPRSFTYPKKWDAYVGHYRTQDPWFSNFRIFIRKGRLIIAAPGSTEMGAAQQVLTEIEPGLFKIGEEETAERLRFDTIVDGKALRANFSGVDFYRVNTP
jgi:D-alanyl-D-alanine carboxypeptidase